MPRMQHAIAARMSDSMGDISLRSAASAAALVSAENSFSSVASDTDARDKPAQPKERGGLLSVSSVGSAGSVGSASGGLTVGVPSPVSVDGFEPTNLADSDEEPEEGAGSVAGPEKTELAAERAGDWVRPSPLRLGTCTEAISSPQMRFLVCAQDDWDDWDEEAEDIDDLVLEFGRCINTLRVEFGPQAARPGAKATAARQHLGISARPVWSTLFAILPGVTPQVVPGGATASSLAPLAPDDDIITSWLLQKSRDLQAARSSGMGAAKAAAPARS